MTRKGRFLLTAFVAVSGLVGLIYVPFRSELRRAHDAAARGSLIANTAAGPIEYATSGAGVAVLSIHGAAGGYDHGLNAAVFLGEGFQVIAPSRFGYLRTPVPADTSPAAQADAHEALLSGLNVTKTIVVGVSAGARSAIELAIRHPDRLTALILIVPGTYSPTSHVSVERSRGSKLVFWLVNNGVDLVWWVTDKIAPSLLIRFIGVPPELVAASSKAEQDRIMNIVRSIQPLVEISGNQY